ncbi:hypothetical protein AB0H00_08250 [Nocardia sp. NPDC023852]
MSSPAGLPAARYSDTSSVSGNLVRNSGPAITSR